MNIANQIRDLYKPIQPAVKSSTEGVTYIEFLPDIRLQSYIYCYWQLRTNQPLSEQFNYLVVADGCIDIVFDLENTKESYVMGFCNKFNEFPLNGEFNRIGIRFLPTMFPQLFNINAVEVSNRLEHLQTISPYVFDIISKQFNQHQSQFEIQNLLDRCFLDFIGTKTLDIDNRLYGALDIILKNCGVVDIQKDLDTGFSPRQLRRIFEFYVGDTAKTFSKVVRFQNILKAKPSLQSLRQHKMFFDAGYYDQSHFIKEFKKFYGVTPTQAFDNSRNNLSI